MTRLQVFAVVLVALTIVSSAAAEVSLKKLHDVLEKLELQMHQQQGRRIIIMIA